MVTRQEDISFQSTPSAWRETHPDIPGAEDTRYFNPLPPHGGRLLAVVAVPEDSSFQSTPSAWRETKALLNDSPIFPFQSTPSAWRETTPMCGMDGGSRISIHSLRMEGDKTPSTAAGRIPYFNPLPPHGGRQHISKSRLLYIHFNPLPPHGGRPILIELLL